MNRIITFFLPLILCQLSANGQSVRTETNSRYNHFIDRLDVLYNILGNQSSTLQGYDTKIIMEGLSNDNFSSLDKIESRHFRNQYDFNNFSKTTTEIVKKFQDSLNVFYTLENETIEENEEISIQKPILKYFYKNPHHFISINTSDFSLRANPIINLSFGNAQNDANVIFQNTRGLRVSGYIDQKIYYYTEILENQSRFNNYVEEYVTQNKAIPGNGLYKSYQSSISQSLNGYDYLNARGYVGVPISKSVSIELGHDRHQIGNGIRSLLLSNFANNYFYLKLNTRVWKLNYQNIFAELNALGNNDVPGDALIPKKYMANHFLSIKVLKNLEFGLFETVIFSRKDHFEFQYLNPIVLYRTIEHSLGSPDNVILGTNLKWNVIKGVSLYGQFALDEFNLGILKKDGWWGNKYGVQAGLKYYDAFGVNGLDAQVEMNIVRPYTYSHGTFIDSSSQYAIASYSHYKMSLAHPLGSNFKEVIFDLRYPFSPKLLLQTRFALMKKGLDLNGDNYGGDILLSNQTRIQDFNNHFLQGNERDVSYLKINASYELFKNYHLDFNVLYRNANYIKETNGVTKTMYIGGSLRINLGQEDQMY